MVEARRRIRAAWKDEGIEGADEFFCFRIVIVWKDYGKESIASQRVDQRSWRIVRHFLIDWLHFSQKCIGRNGHDWSSHFNLRSLVGGFSVHYTAKRRK